jgi:hypothetical protein
LKPNIFIGKIPRQSPHTMNRHPNNEGQGCKTGHVKGKGNEEGKGG